MSRPPSCAPIDPAHESNRLSWNEATRAHNAHKHDQAGFLRAGGSTLREDELDLLGAVDGLSVAHLQCNSGQDSLSLARLGARVTGVDISDEAIRFAGELSTRSGIPARFVREDLFAWFDGAPGRFELAFSSYGTIGWLSDIARWARGVHRILRPGGRLVLMEFHPLVWSLNARGVQGDSYFAPGPLRDDTGVGDYVGEALAPSGFVEAPEPFVNPRPSVGYQYTTAQILQAVIDGGLVLEVVREYPYANGCELFEGMRRVELERYVLPEGMAELPLMLGLVARRP